MKEGEVEEVLARIEKELDKGNYEAVRGLGFYKAVREVKKDAKLAERFAARIGAIDRGLFESKVWTKLGYRTGTIIELIGAVFGVVFLYMGVTLTGTISTLFYLASAILLMTALHPISHSIAGRMFGIRFHFYFLNGPLLIEPTLKVDYSTYVKASARGRALFHLAGALNSFATTLFVLVVALADSDAQPVSRILLTGLWLFTTSSEILPLLLLRTGTSKILFMDFKKTDSYRALREWKLKSLS